MNVPETELLTSTGNELGNGYSKILKTGDASDTPLGADVITANPS